MDKSSKPNIDSKKDIDLKHLAEQLIQPVGSFIKQHLVLIFIGLALFALIYAVFNVNVILQATPIAPDETGGRYDTRFDQPTIDQINALGDRSQPPAISLPAGRINPFSE